MFSPPRGPSPVCPGYSRILRRDLGGSFFIFDHERLAKSGSDWGYNPPDPLARRIHQVLANWTLQPDSALIGAEYGAAVDGKKVVLFANHLSYSDANVLEVMLYRSKLALVTS